MQNTPHSFRWPLGSKAKDKLTGFTGVIGARSQHITGCDTYGLCPEVDKDGKTRDWGWFDEGRIEMLDDVDHLNPEVFVSTSGTGADPQGNPNCI